MSCTCTNVTEINAVHWNKPFCIYYTLYIQYIFPLAYIQKAYPKRLIYGPLFGLYCFPEKYRREGNRWWSDWKCADLSLDVTRLDGFFRYCLNRSSKACPMVFITSCAIPLGHSSMWHAVKKHLSLHLTLHLEVNALYTRKYRHKLCCLQQKSWVWNDASR